MSSDETFLLFVNGTLMRGQELSVNLFGAEFLGEVRTAPKYRLFSIADVHPGMFETDRDGVAVDGELYRVTAEVWRRVKAGEPPDLYRGHVELEDGRMVEGILYPRELAEGRQKDVSEFRGWRTYVRSLESVDRSRGRRRK